MISFEACADETVKIAGDAPILKHLANAVWLGDKAAKGALIGLAGYGGYRGYKHLKKRKKGPSGKGTEKVAWGGRAIDRLLTLAKQKKLATAIKQRAAGDPKFARLVAQRIDLARLARVTKP